MYPFAQIELSADAIKAVGELGLTTLALLVLGILLFYALKTLNKAQDANRINAQATQAIADRIAAMQSYDETQREKSRAVFEVALENFAKVGDSFNLFRQSIDTKLTESHDAIKAPGGVLSILHDSTTKLGELTTQTQTVVTTANDIIASLNAVKEKMATAQQSKEHVAQIEEIKQQLAGIANTVNTIPSAVLAAEKNIIDAIKPTLQSIEKKTDTRPVPPLEVLMPVAKSEDGKMPVVSSAKLEEAAD